MSVAKAFAEHLQETVAKYMRLAMPEACFVTDDVWHDLAKTDGCTTEATFYIKTVDNVNRKVFHAAVAQVQQVHPELQVLQVKSKRPGQNVRFYMKVNHVPTAATP